MVYIIPADWSGTIVREKYFESKFLELPQHSITFNINMEKRFLDIVELAEYLKIKRGTVYVWICYKKIPYVKMGRLIRFDLRKIEKWLEEKSIEMYN